MAAVRRLADGRLHLQDGPIDLVIMAEGGASEIGMAETAAEDCFEGLLRDLVRDLPTLRQPTSENTLSRVRHPVARRMADAVTAWHRYDPDLFVTPMAAVAGSVADHVLAAMTKAAALKRAYVNNGGDIALHLSPGSSMAIGLVSDIETGRSSGRMTVGWDDPIRGVATSGRGGRSWSLGIADAVTVAARSAAEADVAATLIANAVDLAADHPAIERFPASREDPDSDIGDRLVTGALGDLSPSDIQAALAAGAAMAEHARRQNLLTAAALFLKGDGRIVGTMPTLPKQGV